MVTRNGRALTMQIVKKVAASSGGASEERPSGCGMEVRLAGAACGCGFWARLLE